MSKVLIEMESIGFKYPKSKNYALQNINLSIKEGDYVAITGTSGSGKSTLLSILGLITPPTIGNYLILERNTLNLTDKSKSLLKNNEIGFVFQNFNLLSHLNIYDNVALPLSYNPLIKRKDYLEKVQTALELVGMNDYIERNPTQLSGGQQQRIAIARALVNEPSLILADEPTGNLDSENSERIFQLLEQLNHVGKTICLITHDSSYAKKAKKRFHIKDGMLCPQLSKSNELVA